MRRHISLLALVILGAATLYGQATRTWVSGVGDDANPCSRTAPCKTFAGAISKTAPGGEIDALDPGGFGALTITKSITLDGGGGQVASVLVAGTNGIVVAAGATDVVIIRNMRLDGLLGGGNGNAGLSGIRFISGKSLSLENDYIFGFNTNCIDIALGAAGTVQVIDTVVENCGNDGIRSTTTTGNVFVALSNFSSFGSTNGIEAAALSRVTVQGAFIESATTNGILLSGDSQVSIDNGNLTFNGNGVNASTASSVSFVANTKIAFNGTAFAATGGGVNFSYGTNRIHSNGADGTFLAASPGQR